jgi:hypothetical protein
MVHTPFALLSQENLRESAYALLLDDEVRIFHYPDVENLKDIKVYYLLKSRNRFINIDGYLSDMPTKFLSLDEALTIYWYFRLGRMAEQGGTGVATVT